jgi:hypothetical protein
MLKADEKFLQYFGLNSAKRRYHLIQLIAAGRLTVKLTFNGEE